MKRQPPAISAGQPVCPNRPPLSPIQISWMYMDLRDNLLQSLPDGLFAGLNWSMTLGLEGNPGHPFTFIVELEARGNGAAVVRVAQSAPEDMYVTLSAQGGRLSVTEVRINRGTTISEPINVLYDGDGPVTITLEEARILNSIVHFRGDPFQTSLGGPLAMQYVEGTNTPATGAPTISGTVARGGDAEGEHNWNFGRGWTERCVIRFPVGLQRWGLRHRYPGCLGRYLHSCWSRRGQDHQGEGNLDRRCWLL